MTSPSRQQMQLAAMRCMAADPRRFMRNRRRGVRRGKPWAMQDTIAAAIANPYGPRTVVWPKCHNTGGSWLAGELTCWWLYRYKPATVIYIAPTWPQVWMTVAKEIGGAADASIVDFPNMSGRDSTELVLTEKTHFAVGISTDNAQRAHGYKSPNMLLLFDDMPGIRADVIAGFESSRAGGNARAFAYGQPLVRAGPFYEACTTERAANRVFFTGALDTPNFQLAGITEYDQLLDMDEEALRQAGKRWPNLIQPTWVAEKLRGWGVGHPMFQAKVMGQFPTQGEWLFVQLADIEAARKREWEDDGGPVVGFCDVAGPGRDETTCGVRSLNRRIIHESHGWSRQGDDCLNDVMGVLKPWQQKGRLEAVMVDKGYGWHFGEALRRRGYPVQYFDFGKAARDPKMWRDRKAELWTAAGAYFSDPGSDKNPPAAGPGLRDETLCAQLVCQPWAIVPEGPKYGRRFAVGKDVLARDGISSPDRADGFVGSMDYRPHSGGEGLLEVQATGATRGLRREW